MTPYVIAGALFGIAFGICSVLWFLLALAGQLDDAEEAQGIRRS